MSFSINSWSGTSSFLSMRLNSCRKTEKKQRLTKPRSKHFNVCLFILELQRRLDCLSRHNGEGTLHHMLWRCQKIRDFQCGIHSKVRKMNGRDGVLYCRDVKFKYTGAQIKVNCASGWPDWFNANWNLKEIVTHKFWAISQYNVAIWGPSLLDDLPPQRCRMSPGRTDACAKWFISYSKASLLLCQPVSGTESD